MAEERKVLAWETEQAIMLFLARWAPLDRPERTQAFVDQFRSVLDALMDDLGEAYRLAQIVEGGAARTILRESRQPGERGGHDVT